VLCPKEPRSAHDLVASLDDTSLSFTMNALLAFFLGQFSLAVLLFAFIKFFIFGEPPPASHLIRRRASSFTLRRPPSRSRTKSTSVLRPTPAITTESILSKTYYNVSGHQPESLDWFNVLVAQALAQLREDAQQDGAILKSLNEVLNGEHKPTFVGDIRVTEVSLGEEYPIFSNCRVIPVEEKDSVAGEAGARLQARLDVDLSDCITLGVETKLVLNYPKALVAVLPVALAVSIERFSATVRYPNDRTGSTESETMLSLVSSHKYFAHFGILMFSSYL
jgi:maintenance of morphology protein 1